MLGLISTFSITTCPLYCPNFSFPLFLVGYSWPTTLYPSHPFPSDLRLQWRGRGAAASWIWELSEREDMTQICLLASYLAVVFQTVLDLQLSSAVTALWSQCQRKEEVGCVGYWPGEGWCRTDVSLWGITCLRVWMWTSWAAGQGSGCGVRRTWETGLNSRHSPTSEAALFLVCLFYNLSYILCVWASPLPSLLAMEKQFNWI